ncbi:MAG: DUF1800 domain-containing protein, partial [Parvibaculales bacterium]
MRVARFRIFLCSVLLVLSFVLFGAGVGLCAEGSARLSQKMTIEDARHLLSRAGFGASLAEIKEILPLTRGEAIERLIGGLRTVPSVSMPEWTRRKAPPFWAKADMINRERDQFQNARASEMRSLQKWWIAEMVATPSPLTERMVVFWHNHFVASFLGVDGWSISLARQNEVFRRLGTDNFKKLSFAMLRSPAILKYLDNVSNRRGKPNENLAREFMELFTLGEGNYSDADVKEAARALTGYGVDDKEDLHFRFFQGKADRGKKTILGERGNFNGDGFVRILFKQDALANHIATKFWYEFISSTNFSQKEVDRIAERFRESEYDIPSLLRATLQSPAFWAGENRATLIKSPIDIVVGSLRSLEIAPAQWQRFAHNMGIMGQGLFQHPNVGGWPGGITWISPSALIEREQFLHELPFMPLGKGAPDEGGMMMRSENPFLKQKPCPKDTLCADDMYIRYANIEKKKFIVFGLTNPKINDTRWDTLMFRLEEQGGYITLGVEQRPCEKGKCYLSATAQAGIDQKGRKMRGGKKRGKKGGRKGGGKNADKSIGLPPNTIFLSNPAAHPNSLLVFAKMGEPLQKAIA